MQLAVAVIGFASGVAAFVCGFVVEWKQSRAEGPVATVAPLPFAVVSAMLLSLGLANAPFGFPWWSCLVAFPILTVSFGKLILMADARRRR
jgi:hypothetical protein